MNIFKRVINLFTRAITASGAAFSGLGGARWSTRNYENFAKEAYITNFISYRCIDMIAQAVASVPWSVFKQDGTNRIEVEQHPLMRILHRTSPTTGFSAHQYAVASFLGIAGNAYIEKVAPETGPNKGLPFELHVQRPDQIKFVLDGDTKELIGYALEINGKVIKEWPIDSITGLSDLLHVKKFHPTNDIEGLSPVEPAAKSIDTSNEALTWNKSLLQNDARPGTMFIFDGALGDDQFKRLQMQLDKKMSGSENAGKNLIVEGQMKDARPFGFNPKEMDFLEGNWDLARQVCMAFGVPSMLIGIPGESTYNNFKEAREYFWDTTIFFYLQLLKDEYNNWFFPDDDKTFIEYILDDVPALEPRRKEKWEMVNTSEFLTINEKREELGKEKISGGDVLLVPATMIPLDMAGVTEEEVDDSESDMDVVVDEETDVDTEGLDVK